jgi:hypothetical protein
VSERDDLIALIGGYLPSSGEGGWDYDIPEWSAEIADAILAAGWRAPDTPVFVAVRSDPWEGYSWVSGVYSAAEKAQTMAGRDDEVSEHVPDRPDLDS